MADPTTSTVQYDAQRRPFVVNRQTGVRVYLSPSTIGAPVPMAGQAGETFGRHRAQWNQNTGQYERPIAWDHYLDVAIGAGLGLGAASAVGAFSGAGAVAPAVTSGLPANTGALVSAPAAGFSAGVSAPAAIATSLGIAPAVTSGLPATSAGASAAGHGFFTTAGTLSLASTIAQVAGNVYATKKQSEAQKRAAAAEQDALDKEGTRLQENEQRRREEYDRQQVQEKAAWDAQQAQLATERAESQRRYDAATALDASRYSSERATDQSRYDASQARYQSEFATDQARYDAEQAHLAPYRVAGQGALSALVSKAGIPSGGMAEAPASTVSMPATQGNQAATDRSGQVLAPSIQAASSDAVPSVSGTNTLSPPTQHISQEAYRRLSTIDPASLGISQEEFQAALQKLVSRRPPLSQLAQRGTA